MSQLMVDSGYLVVGKGNNNPLSKEDAEYVKLVLREALSNNPEVEPDLVLSDEKNK